MVRPLVLTGGPAVGKSTCGRALAEQCERGAFVDADDVRQLVVSGAEPPWAGDEGRAQQALGARNASAVARNFAAAGFAVTIADVVTPTTAVVYRTALPGCLIVHLRISVTGAGLRAATRPAYLTDAEFRLLHRLDTENPPTVDVVLDVEGLSIAGQVAQIRRLWQEAVRT